MNKEKKFILEIVLATSIPRIGGVYLFFTWNTWMYYKLKYKNLKHKYVNGKSMSGVL